MKENREKIVKTIEKILVKHNFFVKIREKQ